MSAQVIRTRRRRPGPSLRDQGLNQRALGISPRQLRGLPDEEIKRRLAAAAEKVGRRTSGPVTPPTDPTPTVARKRTLGMPGCSACAGSGWSEAASGAVAPCECREGVIL